MAESGGTELERLVVRLVGDATQYLSMLNEATQATQAKGKELQDTLTNLAQGVSQAILGFSLKGLVDKATEEFDTMNRGQIDLKATLKATGQEVDNNLSALNAWAAGVQQVTEIGDDAIMAVSKLGMSLGLTADQAMNATEDAIALGDAAGVSAEAAMRLTAAMEQGDTARAQMFARMIPALRGIKDATEFETKYHQLVAAGWDSATEKAQTFTGQINQLKNDFGDLFEDFGKEVSAALIPFVQLGKELVKWFQELSPAVKSSLVAITMLGAALLGLPPILTAIGALTNYAFGGIPLLLGGVAIGVSALVGYLGGFEETWKAVKEVAKVTMDYLQEKFTALQQWIHPVTQAVVSLATTGWGMLKDAASEAWGWMQDRAAEALEWVQDKWSSVSDDIVLTLYQWRDIARDTFITMEFVLKNFGQVSDYVWTGLKLKAVEYFNDLEHQFTSVLPALFEWISTELPAAFYTGFFNAATMTHRFIKNINDTIEALPDLIRGDISLDKVWKPITEGLEGHKFKAVEIAKRQVGPMEAALKQEFKDMGERLGQDFEGFKAGKLVEFQVADIGDAWAGVFDRVFQAEDVVDTKTRTIADSMKKAKDEAKGFDAALRGSAEAQSRIIAQRLMVDGSGGDKRQAALKKQIDERAGGLAQAGVAGAINAAADRRENDTRVILKDILAALREGLKGGAGEAVVIAEANLDG